VVNLLRVEEEEDKETEEKVNLLAFCRGLYGNGKWKGKVFQSGIAFLIPY